MLNGNEHDNDASTDLATKNQLAPVHNEDSRFVRLLGRNRGPRKFIQRLSIKEFRNNACDKQQEKDHLLYHGLHHRFSVTPHFCLSATFFLFYKL